MLVVLVTQQVRNEGRPSAAAFQVRAAPTRTLRRFPFVRIIMTSNTAASHTAISSALTSDASVASPVQDGALGTGPAVIGQRPDVLTFEAWMGGAGLSGATDDCVESGR